MIPSIGIIISLYALTKYFEMFDKATWKGKIWLVIVIATTFFIMFANFFGSPIPPTSMGG